MIERVNHFPREVRFPKFIRDTLIGLVVAAAGAVLIKYADLPTRISIIESRQASIDQQLSRMDDKLDRLLSRVHR